MVTVEDNTVPTALCDNITVSLEASGSAVIMAGDIDDGSEDACGIASMTVSPNTFLCSDVGVNVVSLIVDDVNGNTSVCISLVTVEDDIAPLAICQNITLALDSNGLATMSASDIDAGTTDACGTFITASSSGFTCADLGVNIVTLTAIDPSGNQGTCDAAVTVEDLSLIHI